MSFRGQTFAARVRFRSPTKGSPGSPTGAKDDTLIANANVSFRHSPGGTTTEIVIGKPLTAFSPFDIQHQQPLVFRRIPLKMFFTRSDFGRNAPVCVTEQDDWSKKKQFNQSVNYTVQLIFIVDTDSTICTLLRVGRLTPVRFRTRYFGVGLLTFLKPSRSSAKRRLRVNAVFKGRLSVLQSRTA